LRKNVKKGKFAKTNTENVDAMGILGKMPDNIESIAELMLFDSDVNVYQESKVVLKEEAFNIRGRKQKTKAQKEEIILDRKNKAKLKYESIKKEQEKKILE